MSDLDATTPRVFLVRHGETEWTKNGRYTGTSDIPLTQYGIEQVTSTAELLVGEQRLLDPGRIKHAWVSPRKRAQQTFEKLFARKDKAPYLSLGDEHTVTMTKDIAEWDYGAYEGLRVDEIRQKRKGLDQEREWSIWSDGCPEGESPQQIATRLDRLVSEITNIQRPNMNGESHADVVLVAHGLILRCFMKRWLNLAIDAPFPVMFCPGAVGILSYNHHNPDERSFYLGLSVPSKKD